MANSDIQKKVSSDIQKKAVDAMIMVNAAIRNLRLYPATSDSTRLSIDKAFHAISDSIHEAPLVFSETERSLFICEQPLPEKEQKKPQVAAFLEILLNFGIKSLEFNNGLTRDEFVALLEVFCDKPEHVVSKGGIQKVLEGKGLTHIQLVQASTDVSQQKSKSGGAGGGSGRVIVKEAVLPMIYMLDEILDTENKEKISKHLAKSIVNREDEILLMVLSHALEGEFSIKLFHHLIAEMDDDKFEKLLLEIKKIYETGSTDGKSAYDPESMKTAYKNMLSTEKGKQLQARIKEKIAREKAEKERQQNQIKTGLNNLLKGETEPLADPVIRDALPSTIDQFFEKDKSKTAEILIEKVGNCLSCQKPEEKNGAAVVLAQIGEKLVAREQTQIIKRISNQIIQFLETEKVFSPEYEKISRLLAHPVRSMVVNHETKDYKPILNVFNLIASGVSGHDVACQELMSNILKEVIPSEILDSMIKEFSTNENNMRKEAGQNLVEFGGPAVNRLLEILKTSEDRQERSRILQIIGEMKPSALPALKREIQLGEPWYYMRNLVLLFGKVGSEDDLEIIMPFLNHKDYRVQRETLGSIYNIGGNYREDILLSNLRQVDDRLKIDIVGMLGALDSEMAIPIFLEMLNSRKIKDELAEKICIALGTIRATQAIPVLSDIIEQKKKGLLSTTRSYGEKVKTAAANALSLISKGRTTPRKERTYMKWKPRSITDAETVNGEASS